MVGASGFEPLASRTRTVRSIRAELRPVLYSRIYILRELCALQMLDRVRITSRTVRSTDYITTQCYFLQVSIMLCDSDRMTYPKP